MRIKCPHCGERSSDEFSYLGDATVRRPNGRTPDAGEEADWKSWMDYVYWRDNPLGVHQELWCHTAGCYTWLAVTRDVRSHAILAVESVQDFSVRQRTGRGAKS